MRLDHIAYRVANRHKTVEFFQKAFGYKIQTEFTIDFGDGDTANCFALEPPEKQYGVPREGFKLRLPWKYFAPLTWEQVEIHETVQEYHLPPEIFVSDGSPNSIVGNWVQARNGIGGVHHLAYEVDSVENTMVEWKQKGYAEFTSDEVFRCEGLTQVFTKPSLLCGIIFEFITREEFGFCKDNVKNLMLSTAKLDANIK